MNAHGARRQTDELLSALRRELHLRLSIRCELHSDIIGSNFQRLSPELFTNGKVFRDAIVQTPEDRRILRGCKAVLYECLSNRWVFVVSIAHSFPAVAQQNKKSASQDNPRIQCHTLGDRRVETSDGAAPFEATPSRDPNDGSAQASAARLRSTKCRMPPLR